MRLRTIWTLPEKDGCEVVPQALRLAADIALEPEALNHA
jgi:hypothetical protein